MTKTASPLQRGTFVAGGEFVLDEEQAREKMREFQLVNPNYYVLEFIKVAHLLKATAIGITIDADEFEMRFDGAPLTPEQLDGLHSAPFSQRGDVGSQALRHLAIGVHAAQGIGLAELSIEVSGELGGVYRLVGDEVKRADGQTTWAGGIRIYLRERIRPGHLLRFVDSMRGRLPKVEILKERCGFARVALSVNGVRIDQRFAPESEALAVVTFNEQGARGQLGITLADKIVRTHVVHHGVLVSCDERIGAFAGARAVIDSARLTLNLSQSAFVEDAVWAEIQKIIDTALLASLVKYLREVTNAEVAARRAAITDLVLVALPWISEEQQHLAALTADFVRAMERLPLFAAATGRAARDGSRFWSIADARSHKPVSGSTELMFATQDFEIAMPHPEGRPVLILPPGNRIGGPHMLGHFADDCRDVTATLLRAQTRLENQRRWEARPCPIKPSINAARDVQLVERVDGLDVSVTWRADKAGVELCYVLSGRELAREVVSDLGMNGLSIYIAGAFDTDQAFAAPKADARFEAAWSVARSLLERTLCALPLPERIRAIESVLSGRLYQGLNDLAGLDVWRLTQAPADALGPLAESEVFSDTQARRWSVRALYEAIETSEYRRILTVDPSFLRFVDDPRLADEIVLIWDDDRLSIIEMLFGWYAPSAIGVLAVKGQAKVDGLENEGGLGFVDLSAKSANRQGFGEWTASVQPQPQHQAPAPARAQLGASIRDQLAAVEGPFRALPNLAGLTIDDQGPEAGLVLESAVLNGSHPAFHHAAAYPDDPVALAFASAALYDRFRAEGFEVNVDEESECSINRDREEFLSALSAMLDDSGVSGRLVGARASSDVAPVVNLDAVDEGITARIVEAGPQAAASNTRGPHDAPITICEFSRFGGFDTAREVEIVRGVEAAYPGQIRVIYKSFPDLHRPHSVRAARALLAAGEQGRFWEMYDLLHKNQSSLRDDATLDRLVGELGLDMTRFKADFEDPKTSARVKREHFEGCAMGVRDVPALFVNGMRVVGTPRWTPARTPVLPIPQISHFKEIIEAQLELVETIGQRQGLRGDALHQAVVEHNKTNVPASRAPSGFLPAHVPAGHLAVSDSYTRGGANAPITIYEFSDFRCTFSAMGAQLVRELVAAYPGKVRVARKNVSRDDEVHSLRAARAALAAGEQGRFWEMYDLIYKAEIGFQNQQALAEDGIFDRLASEIGLNVARLRADMDDPKIAERVERERAEGRKIGVRNTPSYFINNTRVGPGLGLPRRELFEEIIDAELLFLELVQG